MPIVIENTFFHFTAGGWLPWSNYTITSCSNDTSEAPALLETCNQTRCRTCTNPVPSQGGPACTPSGLNNTVNITVNATQTECQAIPAPVGKFILILFITPLNNGVILFGHI